MNICLTLFSDYSVLKENTYYKKTTQQAILFEPSRVTFSEQGITASSMPLHSCTIYVVAKSHKNISAYNIDW